MSADSGQNLTPKSYENIYKKNKLYCTHGKLEAEIDNMKNHFSWRRVSHKLNWVRAEAAEKASWDLANIWFGKEKYRGPIISLWLGGGDKVDSGIMLSYRPARLHRLASRYDKSMPKSTLSPSQRLRIWLLERSQIFACLCSSFDPTYGLAHVHVVRPSCTFNSLLTSQAQCRAKIKIKGLKSKTEMERRYFGEFMVTNEKTSDLYSS